MSGIEWFLLVVVVIGVPLLIAVVVTLWTLEMARQRNRQNRPQPAQPVKRNAVKRPAASPADVSRETGQGSDPA